MVLGNLDNLQPFTTKHFIVFPCILSCLGGSELQCRVRSIRGARPIGGLEGRVGGGERVLSLKQHSGVRTGVFPRSLAPFPR